MPDQPIPIHSAAESQAQWQQVRRLSRWATHRGLRRVVIVLWLAVLALDVALCILADRKDPGSMFFLACILFPLTMWAVHRMGRGLAQPTLEDRAVLTYGEDFDRLKEKQRSEVFNQQLRDHVLARANEDLRDIDLNTRAQAAAWRILGATLIIACFIWWLLYGITLLRDDHQHHTMMLVGLACIVFSMLHQALPIILRLWLEPDPFTGDPQLVANNPQP